MSGQSNVDDKTVADAAKARADTTNNAPVVRRRPVSVVAVAIGMPHLTAICTMYRYCTVSNNKSR
jgi:hypothetical protein